MNILSEEEDEDGLAQSLVNWTEKNGPISGPNVNKNIVEILDFPKISKENPAIFREKGILKADFTENTFIYREADKINSDLKGEEIENMLTNGYDIILAITYFPSGRIKSVYQYRIFGNTTKGVLLFSAKPSDSGLLKCKNCPKTNVNTSHLKAQGQNFI